MRLRRICAIAGSALALATTAPAAEPAPPDGAPVHEPYKLVRSLQALQDQIALGSRAADEAQRGLLIHMAQKFLAAEPEVWEDPKNARAAVIYVLSGGQPEVLRRLIEAGERSPVEPRLLKGALAYSTGSQEIAWRLLKDVDARALTPSLGGHVALVQGNLALQQAPAAAAGFLAEARLLVPGTLVEEAALRRELVVMAKLRDIGKFETLARQYMRRYGRSVYAARLVEDFPRLWLSFDLPPEAESIAKVEELLSAVGEPERREVLLGIARRSLLAGTLGTTRLAAQRALELSAAAGPERLRAQLYLSAAEVAASGDEESIGALRQIDTTSLSAEDAELRDAALEVGRLVRERPVVPNLPVAEPLEPDAEPSNAMIARAQTAIEAVDDLLRRTSR